MLLFCPCCGNTLGVEQGEKSLRFGCHTCPYIFNIVRKVTSRIYPRLKVRSMRYDTNITIFLNVCAVTLEHVFRLQEVDDVLGGSAAWENVDSTEERCPKCSHPRAYFMQIQTRSADEPMTTFYKCCNPECSHRWRD